MDQLGEVVKDPAAWVRSDLTDAAKAKYRDFLDRHPLTPHPTFPVSSHDILGPAPVLPRSRFGGGDNGPHRQIFATFCIILRKVA